MFVSSTNVSEYLWVLRAMMPVHNSYNKGGVNHPFQRDLFKAMHKVTFSRDMTAIELPVHLLRKHFCKMQILVGQ